MMTSKEADRLKRLKKRRDHLFKRIDGHRGKDVSFDIAEASALTWAIDFIEGALNATAISEH